MSVDLDRATDDLYAAAREDFVPLRKRLAKQARAAGETSVAARIEKLAKPTTAAWLANRLARSDPDAVRALVELGEQMRDATERMAGAELRELSQRRPRLIRDLVRRAAVDHDQPVSDAVSRELEEVLTAAITDQATGRALLAGRLTSAREAAPLGAWPDVLPGVAREPRDGASDGSPVVGAHARPPTGVAAAAPRLRAAPAPKEPTPPHADAEEGPIEVEEGPTEAGERPTEAEEGPTEAELAEAREILERARAAVKEAEAARSDSERALHESEAQAEDAGEEVLRLTEQLDAAEARERDSRKRVVAARRTVKDAERVASQAWREVQLAEHRLAELRLPPEP